MEEIKIQPQIQGDSPEHVAEMIKKTEGAGEPQQDSAPVLLAGKYKTEEDLTKGILEILKKQYEEESLEKLYKTLESGLGAPKKTDKEPTPSEPSVEGETEGDTQTPALDFSQYEEELLTNGELSEESYRALEELGYPRHVVDTFIAGQKALAEKIQQDFYSIVGGEENYRAMIEWASVNLSENEIEAYNNALNESMEMAKMAAEALYHRYTQSKGVSPREFIQGTGKPASQNYEVYESLAQLTTDMSDPRYEKDPAFRRQVYEKLKRSNIL